MLEHELATANTVVRGYLRMLMSERHGGLNSDQSHFAREALRAVGRSEALLANLMALADVRTPADVVSKPLHVSDVLESAVASSRPLLEDRAMSVELDLEPGEGNVLGDPDDLERVFVNLLSNCARYAGVGSRVIVQSAVVELGEGEWLCVGVRDEGPGVCAADAERIFEPFTRGQQARDAEGVGLGLAICRRILDAHGGSLEAIPDLGYGLFQVLLPLETEV